jgi:hypothetical protein
MAKRKRANARQQARARKAKLRRHGDALFRAYIGWFEKRYEEGHKDALLDIIDGYLRTGRKAPLWARQEFCDRYLNFADGQALTLNEAFGIPPSDIRTLRTRKTHNRLRPRIVYRVTQLHMANKKANPIGGELFAKVGKELGTSASTVARLYYDKAGKVLQKLLTKPTLS